MTWPAATAAAAATAAPTIRSLLAVRGGSVFSMPGILSTVLFVGMNDEITASLARHDPWHAYDSYRRFLASLAQGVWGFDVEKHSIVEQVKRQHGVPYKQELPWEGMREIAEATKATLVEAGLGARLDEILADPVRQLEVAIEGVHASWHGETARRFREVKGICHSWQTAVIVQEMASGNHTNPSLDGDLDEARVSLTGVVPRTVINRFGGRDCVGEFKFSAAGEDLVSGRTTAISLLSLEQLGERLPILAGRIRRHTSTLRRFMGTDQEIEFTVDRGVLSVLQIPGHRDRRQPGAASVHRAGRARRSRHRRARQRVPGPGGVQRGRPRAAARPGRRRPGRRGRRAHAAGEPGPRGHPPAAGGRRVAGGQGRFHLARGGGHQRHRRPRLPRRGGSAGAAGGRRGRRGGGARSRRHR